LFPAQARRVDAPSHKPLEEEMDENTPRTEAPFTQLPTEPDSPPAFPEDLSEPMVPAVKATAPKRKAAKKPAKKKAAKKK